MVLAGKLSHALKKAAHVNAAAVPVAPMAHGLHSDVHA